MLPVAVSGDMACTFDLKTDRRRDVPFINSQWSRAALFEFERTLVFENWWGHGVQAGFHIAGTNLLHSFWFSATSGLISPGVGVGACVCVRAWQGGWGGLGHLFTPWKHSAALEVPEK